LIRVRIPPPFWFPEVAGLPVGEGTISSEDRVAWNFKVPIAGEISLLEKHQIVPIGGKKGADFGRTG